MQATTLGPNLTGAALSPAAVQAMTEAADALTPFTEVDTSALDEQRLAYITEAEGLGSVPSPTSLKGVVKSSVSKLKGGQPAVLIDKLGERIAFERTGARLYEALIVKYRAAQQIEDDALPPVQRTLQDGTTLQTETPEETLGRIHSEELAHFNIVCEAMLSLGGDPTAQTPCADVTAVASSGILQVLNDPRTTLAQCLNAMLTAEMTDNAGWELLIALAEEAGESELAGRFLGALGQEQEHLAIIKGWLTAIVSDQPRPAFI